MEEWNDKFGTKSDRKKKNSKKKNNKNINISSVYLANFLKYMF